MKTEDEELLKRALCSYLPYDLKLIYDCEPTEYLMRGIINNTVKTGAYNEDGFVLWFEIYNITPILRPLSDLFIKRFDDENRGLRHIDIISSKIFFDNHVDDETSHEYFWNGLINCQIYPTLNQSKELLDFLYKNHYDVHCLFNHGIGLIEKGLAVNYNDLNK